MKSNVRVPQFLIIIAAIIGLAIFVFLPYVSATESYGNYLEKMGDKKVEDNADLTYAEIKNISVFKFSEIYFRYGELIYNRQEYNTFYGVFTGLVGLFALLILLAGFRKRPILVLLLDMIWGGLIYALNWDFEDRHIVPSSSWEWGIAHNLFYPLIFIIIVCAVWLLVEKHNVKKQEKISGENEESYGVD